MPAPPEVVVVGAGPNGLTAAAVLAAAGLDVLLLEANQRVGGGAATAELTLPGFHHDVCAAVHPLGAASPVFRALELERHGLRWHHPPLALAHPLPDGRTAVLERSLGRTAAGLGADREAWLELLGPLLEGGGELLERLLSPLRVPVPAVPLARFARHAVRSCRGLVRRFQDEPARVLLAGCSAHANVPLEGAGSAAIGLVLALAGHRAGWPCAAGGSGTIAEALARCFAELGGRIETGHRVRRLDELPPARAVVLDLTPRQVLALAGDALPGRYRRALARYRYGAGVFKLDWALSEPIPWRHEPCRRAGTVHLGGTSADIAAAERAVWAGHHPERPFVLLGQQSLVDPGRAPAGRHTAWAYCHVPLGSEVDMTRAIEATVERSAPGFGDTILARHAMTTAALEAHDANLVGGDIGGGSNTLVQLLARPAVRVNPYATPNPRLFLCSAATPPGGGVHGMCGFHAARTVLNRRFGRARGASC